MIGRLNGWFAKYISQNYQVEVSEMANDLFIIERHVVENNNDRRSEYLKNINSLISQT